MKKQVLGSKSISEELIDIIKTTPTNTPKYDEAVKELAKTEWAERFGDVSTLVCERDYFNITCKLPNEPIHLPSDELIFLENKLPANGTSPFSYLPRKEIEMDVRYIQLISAIIVHDGTSVLTLKSRNRNKLGLPGGHIDYSFDSLGKTIDEVAHESAVRELLEEVKVKENSMIRAEMRSMKYFRKPLLFDNSSNGWNKFRHRCLIYENKTSMPLSHYNFTTNEKEKHTVEVRSIEKLYEHIKDCESRRKTPECDNWLKETILHLVEKG